MKYIRTKEGKIYAIGKTTFAIPTCIKNGRQRYRVGVLTEENYEKLKQHYHWDIIAQADTIKELIDEYVAKKDCSRPFVIKKYEIYSNLQFGFTIYGSIWTDKGLIYVAKMNDKGELELL